MHKRYISFALLIFLAACNLPTGGTPIPDLVSTQVSNLLTLTPITTEGSPENTAIPTTTTVIPTDTIVVPTETATPTITQSPTPANIPTGTPTWYDTFDNGARFGLTDGGYDDGNTRIYVQNNAMVLTSINANGWRGWRLTSQKPVNYYMKGIFSTKSCTNSDQYGLVVQAPNYETGYGYYFGLTCDGRYSIQRWDENGLSSLAGWNQSTAVLSGSDQTNTIGILKSGNQFELFINDQSVAKVQDDYFIESGYFGPFIAGISTPEFTVNVEEIAYWTLP